jgi:hypothetical protein
MFYDRGQRSLRQGKSEENTTTTTTGSRQSRGRFHQHMCEAFPLEEDEKLFSAHKLGKPPTVFGKKYVNFSLKFRVFIDGEIEQQILCVL